MSRSVVTPDPLFCAWAMVRMQALLAASQTPYQPVDGGSPARHMAYSEGLVSPPERLTADERAKLEARKWGHL
jgi:hypothetical protein